jgi:hypothetical protein
MIDYDNQTVILPDCDCDVILVFPSGKQMEIQCRPSNADEGYNGSLDIVLPEDMPVICWEGEDMKPASQIGDQPEYRRVRQIVTELP